MSFAIIRKTSQRQNKNIFFNTFNNVKYFKMKAILKNLMCFYSNLVIVIRHAVVPLNQVY